MNPKPFVFAAFLAFSAAIGSPARAQARHMTDPGISTHNYKHPNKAAAARKSARGGFVMEASNPALAARFATLDVGRPKADPTPKYAARPVTFVVFTRQRRQQNVINPLISTSNYKTGNGVHAIQAAPDEWICGTM